MPSELRSSGGEATDGVKLETFSITGTPKSPIVAKSYYSNVIRVSLVFGYYVAHLDNQTKVVFDVNLFTVTLG